MSQHPYTGLSLSKSGTKNVYRFKLCKPYFKEKDVSNNFNCSPTSNIYNKGTYSLIISYEAKVTGISPLNSDKTNSKNISI